MGQVCLVLSTSALGLEQLGRSTKFLRPNSLFREGLSLTARSAGSRATAGWAGLCGSLTWPRCYQAVACPG